MTTPRITKSGPGAVLTREAEGSTTIPQPHTTGRTIARHERPLRLLRGLKRTLCLVCNLQPAGEVDSRTTAKSLAPRLTHRPNRT